MMPTVYRITKRGIKLQIAGYLIFTAILLFIGVFFPTEIQADSFMNNIWPILAMIFLPFGFAYWGIWMVASGQIEIIEELEDEP